MTVTELLIQLATLVGEGKGEYVIGLEVGGDGAIHQDGVDHVNTCDRHQLATITGEAP